MIKRLFAQVVETISGPQTATAEDREAALRLATAVLMVDVARADYVFEESEFDRVVKLIEVHFGLSPEQAAELVNEAGTEADELVEVHRFTKLLHEQLSDEEKARIVSLLWQIAYTEVYFTETLWPDFREKEYTKAIESFKNRERLFGRV